MWTAVKIAFFVWLAVKIWKCCCGRRRHKSGGAKAGSYAKLDEEGQHAGDVGYGASATPAAAETATAYGAGGAGYAPAESKYEPMSYAGASIAPSPLNSPDPAGTTHSDHAAGLSTSAALASPPPYTSSTTNGTNTTATATTTSSTHLPPPTTGGEAASYYASMGMTTAYTPSASSTYEPSVLSSAETPAPAYQSAYHPPASPPPSQNLAYPAQPTYVSQTSPGPRYGGT